MAISYANSQNDFVRAWFRMINDAVSRYAPWYNLIRKVGYMGDFPGTSYDIVVEDGSNAEYFSEQDDAPASVAERKVEVTIPWAQIWGTDSVTGLYRALSAGAQPLHSTTKQARKLRSIIRGIVQLVNNGCISGDGSTPSGKQSLVGIQHHIDDSNAVGGVDRSVETLAGSTVLTDVSARDISHTLFEQADDTLINTNEGYYTHIVMPPVLARAWARLGSTSLTKEVRIDMPLNTSLTQVDGFGGWDPLKPVGYFNDRPVHGIPGFAAGRAEFVDLAEFYLEEVTRFDVENVELRGVDERRIIVYRGQTGLPNPRKNALSLRNLQAPS